MKIYNNYFCCIVENGNPSHKEYLKIAFGAYWSIYADILFLLLRLSVLVITSLYVIGSSSINISNRHSNFYHIVDDGYAGPIDALIFPSDLH